MNTFMINFFLANLNLVRDIVLTQSYSYDREIQRINR